MEALESYNNFMPRNQYFKPHTANAKRFLHNAEFINRQIKIHNASVECISSFLGIEGRSFQNCFFTFQNLGKTRKIFHTKAN